MVLTDNGFARLQTARGCGSNGCLTLDLLAERSGLDVGTVSRALARRRGVDRLSLATIFAAFGLVLGEADYRHFEHRDYGQIAPMKPTSDMYS